MFSINRRPWQSASSHRQYRHFGNILQLFCSHSCPEFESFRSDVATPLSGVETRNGVGIQPKGNNGPFISNPVVDKRKDESDKAASFSALRSFQCIDPDGWVQGRTSNRTITHQPVVLSRIRWKRKTQGNRMIHAHLENKRYVEVPKSFLPRCLTCSFLFHLLLYFY